MDESVKKKVVLTGASGGIGEQMAYLLAQKKYSLVLVARSKDKLARITDDIKHRYGTSCEFFVCDLAKPSEVTGLIQNHPQAGILINNAGFSRYGFFEKISFEQTRDMMEVNVLSLCRLCHHYLQGMHERRYGKILNVASTAALTPVPFMSVYASSKAFVVHFSKSLALELAGKNISVSCLLPGPTATGFWHASHADAKVEGRMGGFASPEQVAAFGVQLMERGKPYGISGWDNQWKAFFKGLLPVFIVGAFMRRHMIHPSLFQDPDSL